MIRVEQGPAARPFLELARRELARLAEQVDAGRRPELTASVWQEARPVLLERYSHKCSFCDSKIDAGGGEIEHFRPAAMAVDLDGSVTRPGYWWLAYAWGNLFPACRACARAKASRFPVAGERAGPPADLMSGDLPRHENALLLDPSWDDPQAYLVWSAEGLVASLPPDAEPLRRRDGDRFGSRDRGAVTIDVFALNRSELVECRKRTAEDLRRRFEAYRAARRRGRGREAEALRHEMLDPDGEYVALRRQLVEDWTEETEASGKGPVTRGGPFLPRPDADEPESYRRPGRRRGTSSYGEPMRGGGSLSAGDMDEEPDEEWDDRAATSFSVPRPMEEADPPPPPPLSAGTAPARPRSLRELAFENLAERMARHRQASIEDAGGDVGLRTSKIARVEIENFRPIEELDFDFGGGTAEQAGWKVLLGENSVGKSSVLKAVALALMGRKHFDDLVTSRYLDASTLLRRGARRGAVRLYMAADPEPFELRLTRDGVEFGDGGGLRTVLLGFGAARWLPGPGSLEPETGRLIRVQNLFNPFVPLVDALGWLVGLDPATFERYQGVLVGLLQAEEGTRLERHGGHVVSRRRGQSVEHAPRLDELSDGYQTVLAVAASIIEAMSPRWGDMAAAEGVVLLDEIGSHLHPRWKMRIVSSLRRAFPQVQFLASTHEPLCLRGLYDGEILVLHPTEEGIASYDDLPSPDALGIDQLLTSRLFGLLSTLDPKTGAELDEYYALLAKPEDERTDEDRRRLEELRASVGAGGPLGGSERDREIYRLADEYLSLARQDPVSTRKLKDETRRKVAALWKKVRSSSETAP